MKKVLFWTLVLSIAAGIAWAGPADKTHSITVPVINAVLKPGVGQEKTTALCGICHSLDYITMQPAFSRSQWTAVVNKMIKAMGAPILEADKKVIVDYLATIYGNGT
jgi:sulfite dehydrogenase (cytochrome) subunit B